MATLITQAVTFYYANDTQLTVDGCATECDATVYEGLAIIHALYGHFAAGGQQYWDDHTLYERMCNDTCSRLHGAAGHGPVTRQLPQGQHALKYVFIH